MAEFEENKILEAVEINDDDLEGVSGGAMTLDDDLTRAIMEGRVSGYFPGERCSRCRSDQPLELVSHSATEGWTRCPSCGEKWWFQIS